MVNCTHSEPDYSFQKMLPYTTSIWNTKINNGTSKKKKNHLILIKLNTIIKNLPKKAIIYLTKIFNCLLKTGLFPKEWKKAVVTMIKKQR
jgi:hypothetical protein